MPAQAEVAVAVGGPLDGAVLGVAAADRYDVTLADLSRHRYESTSRPTSAPGGGPGRVFEWVGRF